MVKKLPSFVQESRKGWDVVARKQIAEIEYETIDPKEGDAESEDVDKRHVLKREDSSQEWVGLSCETELSEDIRCYGGSLYTVASHRCIMN